MISKAKLEALIERLGRADGPDVEIDMEIARMLDFYVEIRSGTPMIMRQPTKRGAPAWNLPPYTSEIDGARRLIEQILPGWVHQEDPSPAKDGGRGVTGKITNNRRGDNYRVIVGTHRSSVPIAICIATLRAALEAQGMDEQDLWGRAR